MALNRRWLDFRGCLYLEGKEDGNVEEDYRGYS